MHVFFFGRGERGEMCVMGNKNPSTWCSQHSYYFKSCKLSMIVLVRLLIFSNFFKRQTSWTWELNMVLILKLTKSILISRDLWEAHHKIVTSSWKGMKFCLSPNIGIIDWLLVILKVWAICAVFMPTFWVEEQWERI